MTRDIPIDPVLEHGYDVRLLRDDFAEIVEGWSARSQRLRAGADASLDCAYDTGERDKLDVFRCGEQNAPLFVFIHGGYWQRGDKSVYSDAQPHMKIAQDEIYGPVVSVLEWDRYEEMIQIANGVSYGLTAVLVTDDLECALRIADALDVGYVEVNGPVSFAAGSPYGGWKLSGAGREGNMDELLSYTQLKSINVNYRRSPHPL